ncbi:MAG: nitroreductase family protein, partial [Muribaculaceae bacterium]|nr:nitroreductase family protein [Muribaculaceae bacterium]
MTTDINEYFPQRRTIRRYSDREVPQELTDRLLLEATHAPTTGNMQLYSVIETRDPERLKRLAPFHFNQPQVEGCQVALTFCADFNRFSRWCEERGAEPCYDNLQSLTAAVIDAVAFAQQFNTLAELNGLGVCWLGTTT